MNTISKKVAVLILCLSAGCGGQIVDRSTICNAAGWACRACAAAHTLACSAGGDDGER